MLTSLTIENFQGFKSAQTVNFRAGNLIFGENSSGKSSILRALLLLSQSARQARSKTGPMLLSFQGSDINLASFRNAVHLHDSNRDIVLSGVFEPKKIGRWSAAFPRLGQRFVNPEVLETLGIEKVTYKIRHGSKSWKEINVVIQLDSGDDSDRTGVVGLIFEPNANGLPRLVTLEKDDEYAWEKIVGVFESRSGRISLSELTKIEQNTASMRSLYEDLSKVPDAGLEQLAKELAKSEATLRELKAEAIQSALIDPKSLDYDFGISRLIPFTRGIRWRSPVSLILEVADYVIRDGLSNVEYVPGLREVKQRAIPVETGQRTRSNNRANEKQESIVSGYLGELTNGRYSFETQWPALIDNEHLGQFQVTSLVDNFLGVKVAFEDAGLGLSQVLPVLEAVHNLEQRGGGILLVEQPELHLHPAMQASLMDLFLDVSRSNANIQIVAETHSESMLLRLERRIRQDSDLAGQFSVTYVEFGKPDGSQVTSLNFEESLDFSIQLPRSFSNLRLDEIL